MKNETKLNQTQLTHANQRLTQIYQNAFAKLQTVNYATVVDFNDEEAVAQLKKEAKLPDPKLGPLLKSMYLGTGHFIGDDAYSRLNAILTKRAETQKKLTAEKAPKAQQLLIETQDKLLFGDVSPEEVPLLFKQFEKQLNDLVKA